MRYRTDDSGDRIAIIPATCKRRLHTLTDGYRVTHVDDQVGLGCWSCAEANDPFHSWWLIKTDPEPVRVE